jgi:Flp pilus assembly protein TadD
MASRFPSSVFNHPFDGSTPRPRFDTDGAVDDLDYPDLHHARAAQGWLELDQSSEADLELACISPAGRARPEVLDLRWRIEVARQDWVAATDTASRVVEIAPWLVSGWIHRSYSLHELHRTREAWDLLLPAADRFPTNSIVPYNLACYACQLGDLASARHWLRRTAELKGADELRRMIHDDPDLACLRDEVAGW